MGASKREVDTMYGNVQRTKWSPENKQFLVTVDSQIVAVVNEVTDGLREEFSAEVVRIENLVKLESHVEHSVLVVTAEKPLPNVRLYNRMMHSMHRRVCDALEHRRLARAC